MRVFLAEKLSKVGNKYHTLNVEFDSEYTIELFVNSEQAYIIKQKLSKKGE